MIHDIYIYICTIYCTIYNCMIHNIYVCVYIYVLHNAQDIMYDTCYVYVLSNEEPIACKDFGDVVFGLGKLHVHLLVAAADVRLAAAGPRAEAAWGLQRILYLV